MVGWSGPGGEEESNECENIGYTHTSITIRNNCFVNHISLISLSHAIIIHMLLYESVVINTREIKRSEHNYYDKHPPHVNEENISVGVEKY